MAGWMVKGFQPTCCELLPYLATTPQCPAGGRILMGRVGTDSLCTAHGYPYSSPMQSAVPPWRRGPNGEHIPVASR